MNKTFDELNSRIISCRRCERLVQFRESIPCRASYKGQDYWRKPVPGFGDPKAWLLILGLAPSAHGGNRTGRIFTGDESAKFLFNALHKTEFASLPTSLSSEDGQQLVGCYLTAAVKCVPPNNQPTPKEQMNCRPYLEEELRLLSHTSSILALGQLAFKSILSFAPREERSKSYPFFHGARYAFPSFPTIYASFHPSPQNTYTGKLTEEMMVQLLEEIKQLK